MSLMSIGTPRSAPAHSDCRSCALARELGSSVRLLDRGGTHGEPKGIGVGSLAVEGGTNESGEQSQAR
jgi:hypothetical protein